MLRANCAGEDLGFDNLCVGGSLVGRRHELPGDPLSNKWTFLIIWK